MQDRGPAVGRFFPTSCKVDLVPGQQVITVHFAGAGYAYTPMTKRVGFTATDSVRYRPDFFMTSEDIYVWGKVDRIVAGPQFKMVYVENQLANAAAAVTPLGMVASQFGNQIVAGELTRGFTVVQNWETESNTFSLGIVSPPQRPHTPFDVSRDEMHTFANETVEVQYNQRDFIGPFEVVGAGQSLALKLFLQGPAVDIMIVDQAMGMRWREDYRLGRPMGPPPGPVRAGLALQPGREFRGNYPLPPGKYFVVVDHTQYAGTVAPPAANPLNPLVGPVARMSYVAQLAER